MQYTAFDRCILLKQKDLKVKGFVIIANKLAMNLFFWMDQYCLSFVTLLILLIYINAYRYLSILWSKTIDICEHKALFMIVSCKLQLFDFIQALSNQFNRNWVYFMFYSRTNISFDFNQTGSKLWPIKIKSW